MSTPVASTSSAPGKVILLGEHAVVYGEPALGLPISKRVRVALRPGRGRVSVSVAPGVVVPKVRDAATPRELAERALGRGLLRRYDVELALEVPPMSGLGSSAALAVALLDATDQLRGIAPRSKRERLERAIAVERAAHATPSGVDPAICLWDRPIVFRRTKGGYAVRRACIGQELILIVGVVGAHGGTRKTVTRLQTMKVDVPQLHRAAIRALGEAARSGTRALEDGRLDELGRSMDLAHGVLAGLGLVSDSVEHLVRKARNAGAIGAKMSGAGGDGGAFIALVPKGAAAGRILRSVRDTGAHAWVERWPAER